MKRCLLDTHTLAWAVSDVSRLSKKAHDLIEDNRTSLLVSPASIWEMSIKYKLGKWPGAAPFLDNAIFEQFCLELSLDELPIRIPHTRLAGQFSAVHKDPFDRLLAAQAVLEGATLLSKDEAFNLFPVLRIW